jgi:hypothetical protein
LDRTNKQKKKKKIAQPFFCFSFLIFFSWRMREMESMQDINSGGSRFKKITKENVVSWLYKWRWALSIFAISVVMGIVMWIYRKELFQGLEILSEKLKGMGTG